MSSAAHEPRPRPLTAACLVAAALAAFQLWEMWPVATWKHKAGGSLIVVALLLCAAGAGRLAPWIAGLVRTPACARALAAAWFLLAPLALSPQLGLLPLVAAPLTAYALIERGWRHVDALALSAAPALVALGGAHLALLVMAALIFRDRPRLGAVLALAVGGAARLVLTLAFPRPLWTPDSYGYIADAYRLLADAPGASTLSARPPVVAALAVPALIAGSHFWYVALAHAIGLCTAAWTWARLRRSIGELAALQACAALALSPELVYYEHLLMSEATFVTLLCAASTLMLELRHDDVPASRAFWLGLASAAVAAARPVALAAPPIALLVAWARWPRRRLAPIAAGLALPLVGLCAFNLLVHGFFGLSSPHFRAYVLFSVTGHQLAFDGPLSPEIKAEMRPAIERHNRTHPWWNPETNFIIWHPEGPVSASATLQGLPLEERRRALTALAFEAVRHDPGTFLGRFSYQLFVRYLLGNRGNEDFYFPDWDELRAVDVTYRFVPSRLAVTLPPPGPLRSFEGAPALRSAIEWVMRLLQAPPHARSTPFGANAWVIYKEPFLGLGIVISVLLLARLRPFRAPALALAGMALSMVLMTCAVQEPIPRYRLQILPIIVTLVGIALSPSTPAGGTSARRVESAA